MRLTLALPQLLSVDRNRLNAAAALALLAGFAGAPVREARGLDAALLRAMTVGADTPVAPLAALGAGFDPRDLYVLRADPVALVAGRADVLLTGRVDDLDSDEAASLIDALNRHFHVDELVFHAPRPDAWFVTTAAAQRLDTTPLPEVHGATYSHQPRGDDAKQWRQWQSEMQMLLHAHPVNAARESRGQALVTGIWIWGGGRVADVPTAIDATFHAARGRTGDVLRGLARRAGKSCDALPQGFASLPRASAAVLMFPPLPSDDDVAALARLWLDPAMAALERGTLASLTLLADNGHAATTWHAERPSFFARMRGRFAKHEFLPAALDGVDDA